MTRRFVTGTGISSELSNTTVMAEKQYGTGKEILSGLKTGIEKLASAPLTCQSELLEPPRHIWKVRALYGTKRLLHDYDR